MDAGSQIHQKERTKIQAPGKGKKWAKSHSDSSDILLEAGSIRKAVDILLSKYPYMKPKDLCTMLGIDYKQHGRTVRQRRYEWLHNKMSLPDGLGSKSSKFAKALLLEVVCVHWSK